MPKLQTRTILDLRHRGYSVANIAKLHKCNIQTVYDALNMQPGDEWCTSTRHTGPDTDIYKTANILSKRWV